MALIDHKRLTQAESRLLRMVYASLFAVAGFVVTAGLIVGMFPAPVEGHAVSLVSQETTDTTRPTPGVAPSATAVPMTPETTVPPVIETPPAEVPPVVTPEPTTDTPAPIAEDDPGWRCDTMGNRVCGVPNGNGQFVLVCHDVTGYPIRVVYDPFTCV